MAWSSSSEEYDSSRCLNRMIAAGLKGPSARGTLEETDRSDITRGRKPNQTWLIKTSGILSVHLSHFCICHQIPSESVWLNYILHNRKDLGTVVMVCFSSSFLILNRQTMQVQVKAAVTGGAHLLLLSVILAEYYAIMSLPNCRVYD